MRTRRMVSLTATAAQPDPTLLWYSRAIGAMRTARPFKDPTSWRFQAAMHDYHESVDPYLDPADPPPAAAVRKKYWGKCQHSSWFFLPWHRMYLLWFERIVAETVVSLGGPADWALPYWDYGRSPAAHALPWAFRQPTWPGGEVNHLYTAARDPGVNAGTTLLASEDVETATALGRPYFSTSVTASDVEFGGPRKKNHDGGALPFGALESSPHNHVHVAVGGATGWMTDPRTAALDPIFWLHHCNIDRLWEVWLLQGSPQRKNPARAAWRTGTRFRFHDTQGKPLEMAAESVLDTFQLGYQYDAFTVNEATEADAAPPPAKDRPTELVGASHVAMRVQQAPREMVVSTPKGLEGRAESRGEAHSPSRILLHLENLETRGRAGAYDVYVNIPAGEAAKDHPELAAGRVTLFGAGATKSASGDHGAAGLSFVLDVTRLHRRLSALPGWDPAQLRVTFVPVYPWSADVDVGRVSLNLRGA